VLRRAALGAALAAVAIAAPAPAHAATLQVGIADQESLAAAAPADQALALSRIAAAGGTVVRVGVRWSSIAPTQPPSSSEARNPAWSGYHFERLDQLARAASSAGVQLVPFITRAPSWAEGAGRPPAAAAPAGTWRPSARAFGELATALAQRYRGTFPDPLEPSRTLPRISAWQVWNEPNLTDELTPAWRRASGRWVPAAPAAYRGLLNAFARAANAIDPSVQIITAGTAPFGDAPGGARIPPVTFWRALFCREPGTLPGRRCPTVRFDAYAHHPYPIGPPHRTARNARDVTVPDLGKLAPLVRRAVRDGIAVPRRAKPLWITEISWDSAPDPDGLSLTEQAAYLAGAFSILQRSGARVICWFGLRDQAQGAGWARTYQSGLYARGRTLADDAPKPALAAFSFPFTAYRVGGVARIWGVSPIGGEVRIEAQSAAGWVVVARGPATARGVFAFRLRAGIGIRLRAVVRERVSPEWVTS
jgi:hypothetical protein